ncbi:hypothetical protein E2C01_027994 [Portunus trituberculatus]|uniref:Uncharacterized protein n=1 Tax=Portunus trituberculatus TaxID=210409 RepID=A0A5B7EJD5_PORTR|nr:hypothetical protein [Portunus trituberculatus]
MLGRQGSWRLEQPATRAKTNTTNTSLLTRLSSRTNPASLPPSSRMPLTWRNTMIATIAPRPAAPPTLCSAICLCHLSHNHAYNWSLWARKAHRAPASALPFYESGRVLGNVTLTAVSLFRPPSPSIPTAPSGMACTEGHRPQQHLKKGEEMPPKLARGATQLSFLWPVRGASAALCTRRTTNGKRRRHEAPRTAANCKPWCSNCEHRCLPLVMLQGRCGGMRGDARQGTETTTAHRHVARPCCFVGTRGRAVAGR